jgi:hypothetical protein
MKELMAVSILFVSLLFLGDIITGTVRDIFLIFRIFLLRKASTPNNNIAQRETRTSSLADGSPIRNNIANNLLPISGTAASKNSPSKETSQQQQDQQVEHASNHIQAEPAAQKSNERKNEANAASPSGADDEVAAEQLSSTKKRGRPPGSIKRMKKRRQSVENVDAVDNVDVVGCMERRRSATPASRSSVSSPPRRLVVSDGNGDEVAKV